MRRLIVTALLSCAAVTLVACTPEEIAIHVALITAADDAGLSCPEQGSVVRLAGFNEYEARVVHRLMWLESRCDPDAYNRSGATGLMQVMKMWADDCGGVPADLFNPTFNLACARHVFEVQGWQAWSTY